MDERPLVGSQISETVELFLELHASLEFRMVQLQATSGSGKSRCIREFYRALSSHQPRPAYWPSQLGIDLGVLDPLMSRKVIGPHQGSMRSEPGGKPDYLWLSLTGQAQPEGMRAEDIHQISRQLDLHANAILTSVLAKADLAGQLGSWYRALGGDIARDLLDEAKSEGESLLLSAVGASVPGSEVVLSLAKRIFARHRRVRQALSAVDVGIAVTDSNSLVDEICHEFEELHRAGIPIVLAIEDAHLLDHGACDLISRVARLNLNVLVIATVWPECARHEPYAGLALEVEQRAALTRCDLDALTSEHLVALARQDLPRTEQSLLDTIAKRFNTPLLMELFLSLDLVQDRVHDGRLDLDPEDVQEITADYQSLYARRWAELSPEVKDALLLAMALTGSQGFDHGNRFIAEVLRSVGVSTHHNETALQQGLDEAGRSHWVSEVISGVHGYREPLLAEVVLSQVPDRFLKSQLRSLAASTRQILLEWTERVSLLGTVTEADAVAAQWLLTLPSDGETALTCDTTAKARAIVARSLMDLNDFDLALETLATCPEIEDPALDLAIRELKFRSNSGAGDSVAATEIGDRLSEDLATYYGPTAASTIQVRMANAYWNRMLGRYAAAETQLARLIDDLTVDGQQPGWLLRAKGDLAVVKGYRLDPDAAEAILIDLHSGSLARLGPDAFETLALARRRWRWAGASGRLSAAISGLREVYQGLVTLVGAAHPESLVTAANLGYFLAEAGELDEGLALYEQVAETRRQTLGTKHPDTADAERNVWLLRARRSGPRATISACNQLLDVEFVDKPDIHPLRVAALVDRACAEASLGEFDQADESVSALEGVLRTADSPTNVLASLGEYGTTRRSNDKLQELAQALDTGGRNAAADTVRAWVAARQRVSAGYDPQL